MSNDEKQPIDWAFFLMLVFAIILSIAFIAFMVFLILLII